MYRSYCQLGSDRSDSAATTARTREFAEALLGREMGHPSLQATTSEERKELAWLATISPEHQRRLRRLERQASEAREKAELIGWAASLSVISEAEWDPAKHPRGAFPQNRGWFSPTSGAGGSSSSLSPARAKELASASLTKVPPRMLALANDWWQKKAELERYHDDLARLPKRIASADAEAKRNGRYSYLHKQNRDSAQRRLEVAKSQIGQLEAELRDLEKEYRAAGFDDVDYKTWTRAEMHAGGRGIEQVGHAVQVAGLPKGVTPTGIETDIALGAQTARQIAKAAFKSVIPRTSKTAAKEIFIDAERFPQSTQHLDDAGALNRPLTVNRAGAAENRANALRGKKKVPGMDLDEAPPAVLRQSDEPVSVRPISRGDNRGSGASIGNQLRDVPSGGRVIIRRKPGGKK